LQLQRPPEERDVVLIPKAKGFFSEEPSDNRLALIFRGATTPKNYENVLRIDNVAVIPDIPKIIARASTRWLVPRAIDPYSVSLGEFADRLQNIRRSWDGALKLREESYEANVRKSHGFRPPQIGAIHAVKSHWIVSEAPATLVMPTGTGKTETMLALLISEPIAKLLVIVPSDQLRTQIAGKFAGLGILKQAGLLSTEAEYPVVCTLKHAPKSLQEIDELFGRSQVVVATMQALSRLPAELQDRIAQQTSHLFVDEAHHIGAATWKAFKEHFLLQGRKILQFTATPYRNDNRRVDGRFIFVYPLRRAQQQHLFKPVHYVPVMETDELEADVAIIARVGETLDADTGNNFDHLAMARTSSIDRANALLMLYDRHLPRYKAAVIHSKMAPSDRAEILTKLRAGDIRIIVCVDMLGEGFDLPRLKIAGLHDRHRSEAVTLQFIGRFTRAEKDLGDATVIARVALEDPREWLNALYREDADWNSLLELGSSIRVEHQKRREELYSGLDEDFDAVPIETVTPKLSTFVFRTRCDQWNPEALVLIERGSIALIEGPIVNSSLPLVMAITRHEDRLRWAHVNQPTDIVYNLVMAHWDQEQGLLYVHSSSVEGGTTDIAKLLCGDDVVPLRGEAVFRVLHGFRRVMLTNLGVKETQVKPIRFQLSTGIDITEQLEATVENRSRIKTNMFGHGYVDEPLFAGDGNGETQAAKRTIGCSTKGKIWSQEGTVHPGDWVDWCRTIGPKISDESINTDMVLRNILRPKRQHNYPSGRIPLSIDWPESLMNSDEEKIMIGFRGKQVPLSECDITMAAHEETGPARFCIANEAHRILFSMDIRDGVAVFARLSDDLVTITRGKTSRDLLDLLREDPPAIRFSDGDMLIGADLAAAPDDGPLSFDLTHMLDSDWVGVDITHESQGPDRLVGTIQRATIERLAASSVPYDLIFDGDASGEVADIVAVRRQGRHLDVELYHCKFSKTAEPGARVEDLYEVCGQAMKAVRWADPRSKFLQRLRKQEENRIRSGGRSRFQVGDRNLLDDWITNRRELATRFSMTLVQPGYSKAKANPAHLSILGAVRSYLTQTYNIGFSVWSSK
jgi:superfamily II DNA or RNA helicase